jgi:hypothetical protein
MPFKPGDQVIIKNEQNRVSDFEADATMSVTDGTTTNKKVDAIFVAIFDGKPFTVVARHGDDYELKLGKISLPFMPEEDDLIPAP